MWILTLKRFSKEIRATYGVVKRYVHDGMPVVHIKHKKKSKRVQVDFAIAKAWVDERQYGAWIKERWYGNHWCTRCKLYRIEDPCEACGKHTIKVK